MTIKMRIELSNLATHSLSGVSNYTRLLAEALDRDEDISLTGSYFNFLNRQPEPIINIPKKSLNKIPFIPLRVYAKLQSFNIAPPYDILFKPTDVAIFPNFATWPTINAKKTAAVIHDLTYLYFPELVEEKNLQHLKRVVPRSIKKADAIITVSESVKAELVKEFNLSEDRCLVTTIPPDQSFYNKLPEDQLQSVKSKYGILHNEKYIYFIGNFEPRKNLSVLIEAYSLLPSDVQDNYTLILAGGKGWNSEKTQNILNDTVRMGHKIRHIGFVEQADSPALFQAASLFVMPSLYEGFGMPILEAMASGTPVISSNIPVLHEVGGEASIYANPHSPNDFAKKIEVVLSETAFSDEMIRKGLINVQKFSWERNVEVIKHFFS